MRIADVMSRDLAVVQPDMRIEEAAKLMRQGGMGFLPVCDGGRLVGTLTDRDIVMRSTAEGQDPNASMVQAAMSADVAYCYEDQDTNEAASLMAEKQVRRLPIVSREKRLVGILSQGDLATRTPDDDTVGQTVEGISEPTAGSQTL